MSEPENPIERGQNPQKEIEHSSDALKVSSESPRRVYDDPLPQGELLGTPDEKLLEEVGRSHDDLSHFGSDEPPLFPVSGYTNAVISVDDLGKAMDTLGRADGEGKLTSGDLRTITDIMNRNTKS